MNNIKDIILKYSDEYYTLNSPLDHYDLEDFKNTLEDNDYAIEETYFELLISFPKKIFFS